MDALDIGSGRWRAVIWVRAELGLGSIGDWGDFERRELAFVGNGMVVLEEEGCNVFLHGEAAGAIGVVPGKVDAGI